MLANNAAAAVVAAGVGVGGAGDVVGHHDDVLTVTVWPWLRGKW